MSELPKEWLITQHGEVADVNPGIPPTKDVSDSQEVSFLPMNAVQAVTGKYDLSHVRKFGEVKKGYTPVIDGDVIFAKITPCMENGKIAVLAGLKNGIGFGSTEFHVSRPCTGIDARYLFYYFVQSRFREDAKRHMSGSAGQLRVPSEYFKSCIVPLAASKEQGKVVEKIEELFSDLDSAIENLKKVQEQLKVYEQAVLQSAFEGKIISFNETEEKPLGQIGKVRGGKRLPKGQKVQDAETKYPYIRVVDFKDFSVDLTSLKYITEDAQKKIARYIIHKDEVFISIAGTIGRVGMIPERLDGANLTENAAKITEIQEVHPRYLMYYLASPRVQGEISFLKKATSQPKLALYRIEKIQVKYPRSIDIQQEIVQEIESRLSVCDKIQETIYQNIQNSDALRQSILKRAFEGKLTERWRKDHKSLISGDNSAEALLRKITDEKKCVQIKSKGKKKHD